MCGPRTPTCPNHLLSSSAMAALAQSHRCMYLRNTGKPSSLCSMLNARLIITLCLPSGRLSHHGRFLFRNVMASSISLFNISWRSSSRMPFAERLRPVPILAWGGCAVSQYSTYFLPSSNSHSLIRAGRLYVSFAVVFDIFFNLC